MLDYAVVQKLALALGLGLLVGFQRERTAPHVTGLRTMALLTVLGTICGLLVSEVGTWLPSAGLIVVAALVIAGNFIKFAGSTKDVGLTTQAATLIMYLVGLGIAFDRFTLGILVTGGTAILLYMKEPMHRFVRQIGEAEFRLVIQLVLIALVILPILPNRAFDRYGVLNPFEIWLMVSMIVGISLVGYLCNRLFGSTASAVLSGLLGGLVSSTATTVSYARRSRHSPQTNSNGALVIMIASTVVFGRVLIEVAIVSPDALGSIYQPLGLMMVAMILISASLYVVSGRPTEQVPVEPEASELKVAITFGLLYAAVLYAVAAVRDYFGEQGLYWVAGISGLTDMDAITLSTSKLIVAGHIESSTGWRMILLGGIANLIFKLGIVATLGHRALFYRMLLVIGAAIVAGGGILAFWHF